MRLCCFNRKGDLTKCIPIYAIGAIFLIIGVPLMIAGIIGGFNFSDFIGYVGGACIFFGIMFWFLWHMITIPNTKSAKELFSENEEVPHNSDIPPDAAIPPKTGYSNLGYERECILPGNDDVIIDSDNSSDVIAYDVIDPNLNNSNNRSYVNEAFVGDVSISTISMTEENNVT